MRPLERRNEATALQGTHRRRTLRAGACASGPPVRREASAAGVRVSRRHCATQRGAQRTYPTSSTMAARAAGGANATARPARQSGGRSGTRGICGQTGEAAYAATHAHSGGDLDGSRVASVQRERGARTSKQHGAARRGRGGA
jgi:hypothetical protein